MLAVLLLNRMSAKRRSLRKEVVKPVKTEVNVTVDHCRTCLSTEDLVSIFYNRETAKKRSEDLRLVTGLKIKMNDGLSQKICPLCIDIINTSLQFRRTSKKTEKTLLNRLPGRKRIRKLSKPVKTSKTLQKDWTVKEYSNQKLESDYSFEYNLFDDGFQNDYDCDVKDENSKPKIKQKPMGTKKRIVVPNASSYKCVTCNKEFRMKATYKAHMRFHTNYCVCESCGKRCRNNNQLQEHKRARHGLGRIHSCAYCEYTSATKEALTIHERRHTGERPYICDHCGATFHRRSNLVQHIAIHLPEKNFQCDMCPKRLKSRKFLQIHKHNAHTGKRYGYLCPICKHRFEKPNKVRAHTRRVHGLPDDQQGAIVRCSMCPKREKSRKLLAIHEYKYHRENRYRYICPVCSDTFTRPGNVRQHLARSHGVGREDQGVIEKCQVTAFISSGDRSNQLLDPFGDSPTHPSPAALLAQRSGPAAAESDMYNITQAVVDIAQPMRKVLHY